MGIEGIKREHKEFSVLKVGLLEASVICVNPDEEQYKELLGIELKEESKATEYLTTNDDGNTVLRLDFWIEDVKTKDRFKIVYFLENKERENKDETKTQYINSIGNCSWSDDPNNLPDWFVAREYRVAFVGEEDLYNFLKSWLSELDYRNAETVFQLDWKKLMKGNVKEIKEQINGEWSSTIGVDATVAVKERDGEIKEYQGVFNKAFFPPYSLKTFRLVNYSDQTVIDGLKAKKLKDLKMHEKFVLAITDPLYGCKDIYILKDVQDYNSSDYLVATDKVIKDEDSSY